MGMPGIWELVIIFLIVLLVFGAGKIPKIAKDVGSGIREFKKSITGEDESADKKK
ncbi:MAG TPA: twin-arginine translocase TatA/TatE family subunit [Spirochaetota bacterium]|nr:twin-arginine translocase TatA/TatE family subunit [Spirochaetota bacterium]